MWNNHKKTWDNNKTSQFPWDVLLSFPTLFFIDLSCIFAVNNACNCITCLVARRAVQGSPWYGMQDQGCSIYSAKSRYSAIGYAAQKNYLVNKHCSFSPLQAAVKFCMAMSASFFGVLRVFFKKACRTMMSLFLSRINNMRADSFPLSTRNL